MILAAVDDLMFSSRIRAAAQAYADWLAEMACAHPCEWFHFEPFLVTPETVPADPAVDSNAAINGQGRDIR